MSVNVLPDLVLSSGPCWLAAEFVWPAATSLVDDGCKRVANRLDQWRPRAERALMRSPLANASTRSIDACHLPNSWLAGTR